MKRIVLAGLVGGVVYFVWGMAAWMFLGIHDTSLQQLPDDSVVTGELTSRQLETGVYTVPFTTDSTEMSDPESEFVKAHNAGPIYTIYYNKEGAPPMGPDTLISGLVIDLFAVGLAACLLSSALADCRSYARRVGFVIGLGIFVALAAHGAYWNWMRFPTAYTIHFIVDSVIGWTLVGLVIAAIVKPTAAKNEAKLAAAAAGVTTAGATAAAAVTEPKTPSPKVPPQPIRNDAITLLATLQREARFVDIVKEPLGDYSDAQVGAAARDVLRDCGAVLDRLFELQPVIDQEEGSQVDVPSGFDAGQYRISGNVAGEPPYTGPLVHHGWEAKKCSLPQWSGSKKSAQIVAPAELEVK